ncbi:MAG: ABC transporter substrate-binding protein [Janthinobacterium lividum]
MKYFWVGWLLAAVTSACSLPIEKQANTVVRIRWSRDPESLSPLELQNQAAVDAVNLLHCGLLRVDFSTGNYSPSLADSLPRVQLMGDSATQLHYRLRNAATWDTGRPVLASDVAFTLKLMLCPGLPNEKMRGQVSFIQDIKLDSADLRRFTFVCHGQAPELSTESGDFPILSEAAFDSTHVLRHFSVAALANYSATAKPEPALAALAQRYREANFGHHPERLPGCGPYRLAAWKANRCLTFTRKPHWWADGLRPKPFVLQVQMPQIQFIIISDDAVATLALRRHEIDVLPQVSAREFKRLQASATAQQELSFYSTVSYDIVTAGFNTQRAILHDSLTRQALGRLFDPVHLVQATQLGQGLRTVGLVHPSDYRYYHDGLPLLTYSPAQAAALLKRAGWVHQRAGWVRLNAEHLSERLTLALHYRVGETTFKTIALQFKAAAALLDIPVELRPTEASLMLKTLREGDFDMYILTQKGNPFAFNYAAILHSRTVREGNFTKFGTANTDRLIEAVAAASSSAQKRKLLRRFQVMMQRQMPLVPLFFLPYRLAADRRIQHLYPSKIKPGYSAATIIWASSVPAALAQ